MDNRSFRHRWIKEDRTQPIKGFIGSYLIAHGALTLEGLDRGLERQLQLAGRGQQMLLGEVLIEMGLITREQLDHALERQANDKSQR